MFVLHFGDSFVLPHYRPYDELGIYRLAYKIAMLVSSVYGAFALYWTSQVFHLMKREDSDEVFARVFTYLMLGISFFSFCLIVCARPVLSKLAGPAFQDAAALVPVLVIAYFLRSIGDFMRALFLACGRPGYEAAATWLGAIACIAGYGLLIPKFGIWGAAFATLSAFAVLAAVSFAWAYRLRPYRVEGLRLAKVAIALAAGTAIWLAMRGSSFGSLVLAASLSMATVPVTLWLTRFPSSGELDTARAAVQRVLRPLTMGRG
jgi:O-antigen/teichoic acid export membrane protein